MEIRDLFASLVVEDCDEEELEELISKMKRFRDDKKTFSTPARSSRLARGMDIALVSSRVKKKEQEDIKTPVRSSERVVEKEMSTDLRRQVLLKVKHRLKSALKSSQKKNPSRRRRLDPRSKSNHLFVRSIWSSNCMEKTPRPLPTKTPVRSRDS